MIQGLICWLAILAGGGPSLPAHPGPPVFVELHLGDGELSAVLNGEQRILSQWFGMEGLLGVPLSEDERSAVLLEARRVLSPMMALEVDGQRLLGRVQSVVSIGPHEGAYGAEPSLVFQLDYALLEPPQEVALEWSVFPEDTLGGEPRLPVHLLGERSFDYVVLTAEEPRWTWHRDLSGGLTLPPVAPLLVTTHPVQRSATLLILGLAGGLAAAGYARNQRRSLGMALGGILLAGAWANNGPGALVLPSEDQSLVIQEALMRRVYAAFDSTTEEGIYRLLASSVEPELLDSLYQGIHGSLVQADEGGGARGRVESLEFVEAQVHSRVGLSGRPAFEVEGIWIVGGRVIHFGHEHGRRVRYGGRMTIVGTDSAQDGPSWRLAGLDVHFQERMEAE